MKKSVRTLIIVYAICLILSLGLTFLSLGICNSIVIDGQYQFLTTFCWTIFWFVVFALIANIIFGNKMFYGRTQEVVVYFSSQAIISAFLAFVLYALIKCGFNFTQLDWYNYLRDTIEFRDGMFYLTFAITFVVFNIIYLCLINRKLLYFFRSGIRGKGKLKEINANLENSRWMNEKEKNTLFKAAKFSELNSLKKDGIPVAAELNDRDKDMKIRFNSPCHSLIIGSTGSGKTTTFVSPMIQLLAATSAGSSMVITDPKGELYSLHSKFLKERGYEVKVIDLRDTYYSDRWNPLEGIFDNYEKFATAYKSAYTRTDDPHESGLELLEPIESFQEEWYEFDNKGFATYDQLLMYVKVYKKKLYDEVYEDLNDLVTILIPVENAKDPTWEKGARAITLAVLLAMLEDYHDGRFGMDRSKYNFFNLAKILQNSSDDYAELRRYFVGRNPLSRAASLAKQVIDAAPQTRASYMSIVYEKLTLFNDGGICALTSSSDFHSEQLNEKPTALFLKIPDEKDTRHNLAAIFILNIYKTLIKVASAKKDLCLDRNVYFIMDEFGNMPKIEKFDKFITVGRSRKIWFNMIIQSYSQLNNVYGETIAEIVKGNCGIKMFIGSNDMATCKEYSELCGNITVVTSSSSSSIHSQDVNISSQTQVRPLIYPSELQRLNRPGDLGHSVIVTFGNYPLKTYFTPSFKVPLYKFGKIESENNQARLFEEKDVFYDITVRNEIVFNGEDSTSGGRKTVKDKQLAKENKKKEKKTKEEAEEEISNDVEEMIRKFKIWKEQHPDGSMNDFYSSMSSLDADELGKGGSQDE